MRLKNIRKNQKDGCGWYYCSEGSSEAEKGPERRVNMAEFGRRC